MRVIITGGTGLIGRSLTSSLLDGGHDVIVLSRNPDRASDLLAGARAERWDGRTLQGWGEVVDGSDAIVNLAGENIGGGLWTTERKRRLRESRLDAGRAVVQAIQAVSNKPRILVQASGIGYYGFRGDEKVTEEDAAGDDFLALLSVAWEASTEQVEASGVRRAVIRSGGVLTTKGGALPKMLIPFKLFAGGPLGSGRQWFPWIHISDEVRAIRFLIDNETASGPFNLVAPNPLTNADFGRVIARVMGRPFYMPAPSFALRIGLGQLSSILLEGQRAVPKRLTELGVTFQFPRAEPALEDLLS